MSDLDIATVEAIAEFLTINGLVVELGKTNRHEIFVVLDEDWSNIWADRILTVAILSPYVGIYDRAFSQIANFSLEVPNSLDCILNRIREYAARL